MSIPYLSICEQEQYLRDHHMIDAVPLSDEEKRWLESINFHYLMGYARNYRDLVKAGIITAPQTVSALKELIEAEEKFIAFLTPWLRKVEWHLRALTVKNFCSAQEHGEGYLCTEKWIEHKPGDVEKLLQKIIESIRRHGENYTTRYLDDQAIRNNITIPQSSTPDTHQTWLALLQDLPLWAVIDSFSIGTLGRFIMLCHEQPKSCGENMTPEIVWMLVSQDLGITKKRFSVTINSFGVLRNMVFHHQRLWMRPMAISPGMPKDLEKKYRDGQYKNKNKQAQFVVLAVLSKILPKHERQVYLEELDKALDQHATFKLGIVSAPFAEPKTGKE
ncbi:MAG: Abi family protein [Corynebacterium sp.]|uniref:Abi family protein n=1 Tax=Corynebacterium sp. TaxID=1720 RepID=UPI0026DC0048|nr:Abi family protein [Corynebacterium sp.]MDO4762106.1 Abi family protein [Corynebacterium sp.]